MLSDFRGIGRGLEKGRGVAYYLLKLKLKKVVPFLSFYNKNSDLPLRLGSQDPSLLIPLGLIGVLKLNCSQLNNFEVQSGAIPQ